MITFDYTLEDGTILICKVSIHGPEPEVGIMGDWGEVESITTPDGVEIHPDLVSDELMMAIIDKAIELDRSSDV